MSTGKPQHQLISTREAAEQCGVEPLTIKRWVRRGLLPAVYFNSRTYRIEQRDLDEFISKGKAASAKRVDALVDSAPALSSEQAGLLRAIFSESEQTADHGAA